MSFRREKFVPRGGPDGGQGGKGGDVSIRVNTHYNTFNHLFHQTRFIAENGQHGQGNNCYGKGGKDRVIDVPQGTIIMDKELSLPCKGNILKDLKTPDDSIVVAKGGKGGRGNTAFATSINQAPRCAEKGEPGEERWLYLELKLIADVGLVGLPNAGKSTLLSVVSSARPKIASYPFTTLEPYLGVVRCSDQRTFVMADLPGLIEGAHKGKGLGHKFLRHIERTRMILHLIDFSSERPIPQLYREVRKELTLYSKKLSRKPEIIVATKMDIPIAKANLIKYRSKLPGEVIPISAVQRTGLNRMIGLIARKVEDKD
ncbi:MAG: GTPase ObgE [Planctomycetota bacterium]|nr:GTPase ObgE [Planctomycetota bacterium]